MCCRHWGQPGWPCGTSIPTAPTSKTSSWPSPVANCATEQPHPLNAFIALLRKHLVLHLSNRRAILMNLVAPILIAAFFGSLFGGGDKGPAQIPVVLTDLDQSELSARIVANLRGDLALRLSEASAADAQARCVPASSVRPCCCLPASARRRPRPYSAVPPSPRWWCSMVPLRRWCCR